MAHKFTNGDELNYSIYYPIDNRTSSHVIYGTLPSPVKMKPKVTLNGILIICSFHFLILCFVIPSMLISVLVDLRVLILIISSGLLMARDLQGVERTVCFNNIIIY